MIRVYTEMERNYLFLLQYLQSIINRQEKEYRELESSVSYLVKECFKEINRLEIIIDALKTNK